MIPKSIVLDEIALRWKAIRRPLAAGILVVTGVVGLLTLIVEMDGTIPDPPMASQSAASVAFAPAAANGLRAGHAAIDRQRRDRITEPADPTRTADTNSTGPGQWLINDVAETRAKPGVTQAKPRPLPAIAATTDAHVETPVAPPASSGTRLSTDEQGAGASAGGSARADTSRQPDDAKANCMEAPVGQAPEGKRWYYRFDREDHRKCWYVRSRKHDASSRSSQHSRSRRTWVNYWRPWDIYW